MKANTHLNLTNGNLYLIYARKSTEDKRQLASIPDQLQICHRLEEKQGIIVPEEYIFTDEKTGMKAHRRVGFNQMKLLIELAVTRQIKIIVISWDAARLARNNEEGGFLVDRVRDEQLKITTDLNGSFDETNYAMLNIHFGFSSEYSKKTSQGVLRNMRGKIEKGICPTAAHLGYMFDPMKPKGLKDVIKNPLNWDKCREWVKLMLTGRFTVEQTLEIMTADKLVSNDGTPVSKSKAYHFFRDIYNTGMFRYHGELYQGNHPPLMSMAEYNRIRTFIKNRGAKKAPLQAVPLMGLFKCGECDATVTAERHLKAYKNGKNQLFVYYHCTRKLGPCKEKAISETIMDMQVQSYVKDVEIVPAFVEWLRKALKRQNQVEGKAMVKAQELQAKRLVEITTQKFQLRNMKDEGYFPDEQDYKQKKEELLKQEQIVKQEIVDTDDSYWDALFEDTLKFALHVKALYEIDDPVIKRKVVEIIGLNFKLQGQKLQIQAKNAFVAIHRIKKELWEQNLWIEPTNSLSYQAKQLYSDSLLFSGALGES